MSHPSDDFPTRFDGRGLPADGVEGALEVIDQIMEAFVRWAWGDDPVDDALGINQLIDSKALSSVVKSETPLLEPYNHAATARQEGKEHERKTKPE